MIPDYTFRTEHPNPRTTRFLHLLFYFGAMLLLVAAVHSLYRYFTEWTVGDDNSHIWSLVLGLIYLIASILIGYFTYSHGGDGEDPPERFVEIEDGVMTYSLDQVTGRQVLDLATVREVSRPSVRELILSLRDGERVVLPVYLIDDEDKQRELESILTKL
ncbi:hypothetical protein GGR28_002353 [Lewinella aquimaris]|uniref:Uncharacterized protein n=1 Tax=Neolewinella aquimaris TaxID=1835722 RepID=A0A840ECM0_9BACT|nr:DUF308 domain-containing protein [Neolewinella aquimaris]MBB4079728.1 hypothetical protein [Neolewinella aquimaris]